MTAFLITSAALGGGFVAFAWFDDRFATLNEMAADVEAAFLTPFKLGWETLGNPITWAQHTGITVGVSALGAALGSFMSVPAIMGAFVWASGAAGFYVIRELYGFYEDRGLFIGPAFPGKHPFTNRVVDGLADFLFPA